MPNYFKNEVATRATKKQCLGKNSPIGDFMSEFLYFIFHGLACGVNYGVSKQLLPIANQPKCRFALEVPGI